MIAEAPAAVARKVSGMTQVADPAESDHRVEVLFTRGGFEVYVDALPPGHAPATLLASRTGKPWDYSMERADSERPQPK